MFVFVCVVSLRAAEFQRDYCGEGDHGRTEDSDATISRFRFTIRTFGGGSPALPAVGNKRGVPRVEVL
jgi:hypothetical protein